MGHLEELRGVIQILGEAAAADNSSLELFIWWLWRHLPRVSKQDAHWVIVFHLYCKYDRLSLISSWQQKLKKAKLGAEMTGCYLPQPAQVGWANYCDLVQGSLTIEAGDGRYHDTSPLCLTDRTHWHWPTFFWSACLRNKNRNTSVMVMDVLQADEKSDFPDWLEIMVSHQLTGVIIR